VENISRRPHSFLTRADKGWDRHTGKERVLNMLTDDADDETTLSPEWFDICTTQRLRKVSHFLTYEPKVLYRTHECYFTINTNKTLFLEYQLKGHTVGNNSTRF
jgi:hypothetical protein